VFHLCDFGTKKCQLGSREWDRDTRTAFLKRLGQIINREGVSIISASAEMSKYAAFIQAASHAHVFGPAYSGLAQLCAHLTERTLLVENRFREKTAYAFEKGSREHELAKMLVEYEERTGELRDTRSHHFLPKSTTLLQPADLIAGTVQHVLLRAYAAIKCLDNGRVCTSLHNFERYFSGKEATEFIIPPLGSRLLRIVANRSLFGRFDLLTEESLQRKPDILDKRLKQTRNQGKRSRRKGPSA
jgi:hypothetical protein